MEFFRYQGFLFVSPTKSCGGAWGGNAEIHGGSEACFPAFEDWAERFAGGKDLKSPPLNPLALMWASLALAGLSSSWSRSRTVFAMRLRALLKRLSEICVAGDCVRGCVL